MAFSISLRSAMLNQLRRADILLQALQLARAGDGHDPGFLRQQPGQGDLGRGGAAFAAIRSSSSITARLALIASGVKRGLRLRISELSKVVVSSILPVR